MFDPRMPRHIECSPLCAAPADTSSTTIRFAPQIDPDCDSTQKSRVLVDISLDTQGARR